MKPCVELLRSCGINILVVFSDIPVFVLDNKLPPTLNIELVTLGTCPGEWNSRNCLFVYRLPGKDHNLEGSNCAVKVSCNKLKSRGVLTL